MIHRSAFNHQHNRGQLWALFALIVYTPLPLASDRPWAIALLTHHCHIVETGNDSYRFQHSSLTAKSRIKSREQKRRGIEETTLEKPF